MALSIKIVTPPAIEPVTVSEAKRHLRVDWSDDDMDIASYISAAREWMERKLDRATITRTLRATFDWPYDSEAYGPVGGIVGAIPRFALDLPYPPQQTVSIVEIESDVGTWTALTAGTDYLADLDNEPGRVWLRVGSLSTWFPSWDIIRAVGPRVRITYTAGYGATADTVPFGIRDAIKRATAHLYENREAGGVIPETLLPSAYMNWTL
ncbi:MAG: head-tail connector protein [Ktedonobacterales bacterium]